MGLISRVSSRTYRLDHIKKMKTEGTPDEQSSSKSTAPSPETHKSQVVAALFTAFPKKDERNFTVGAVVSDCPAEFDSFEQSKELHLNNLPIYVKQSDKNELTKIINDPTNEILRYLESQNNTVDSKESVDKDERPKAVPKRKNQTTGKRKNGVFGNLSSSLADNNSGSNSPSQSKRSKH